MTEIIETTAGPQVINAITQALEAVLQRDLGDLAPDTELFGTLGLDSTGVLDLLLRLEELLDGEFDTDELEMSHFATVRSLADFITTELGR